MKADFSTRLIRWQRQHGRHDLPWQNTRDPYAVWVSEIMLQQTQVTAVIPYYQRFMIRFPDLASLAAADQESVLQHWSGLGYYSRARNLHAAAQRILSEHGGVFPRDPAAIQALPGIGRSTAAAIAAFCFGARTAILDGNVKRVLARCFGIDGWPGAPAVEKRLWDLADLLLPARDIERYTQGLMDLGATLCSRGKPDCALCPMQEICVARQENRVAQLPAPRPRKASPLRETVMLLIIRHGEVLLEKRPSEGIWGGLWSLPEMDPGDDPRQHAEQRFGLRCEVLPPLPVLLHALTHFRLQIRPQPLRVTGVIDADETPGRLWLELEDAAGAALPSPVRKLLQSLNPM
ncbi:MAG: A/G-specific adenine glycosylase [Methylobacterium sp.]|nr:A/G-specific adenine glycosylase [Methylobacterium sp.]